MSNSTGAHSEDLWKKDTPQEIHIWEFPQTFWVQLEPGITQHLVEHATEKVGGLT